MIPKIRKVLYATDLSSNSAYAFRHAMNTALMHKAKIVILHVIEPIPPHVQAIIEMNISKEDEFRAFEVKAIKDAIQSGVETIKRGIEKNLAQEFKDSLEYDDLVSAIVVVEGYPVEEILKKADEYDCDVIIVGSHGKGALTHAFLGSVAKKLLRRSRKPIYVIPLPEGFKEDAFGGV
ncbi:MAG TPA: universal stress protein [Deltaproteobacteria bacterium]|nr:universal stress protein [Deltaproteobacteria bacterium]